MITRQIRIYNSYTDDGEVIENEQPIELLTPEEFAALPDGFITEDGVVTDYAEYVRDVVWPLTGTGRSGDAYYNVSSIDGLEPAIDEDWWG